MPCIDQLFDETLLVGTGWTTRDTVRSLAYSILADLVHHIRSSLSLPQLSAAVHLFSKNVHDDTFPVSIQTMSCKVRKRFDSLHKSSRHYLSLQVNSKWQSC